MPSAFEIREAKELLKAMLSALISISQSIHFLHNDFASQALFLHILVDLLIIELYAEVETENMVERQYVQQVVLLKVTDSLG